MVLFSYRVAFIQFFNIICVCLNITYMNEVRTMMHVILHKNIIPEVPIGVDYATVRKIPFAYNFCSKQLELLWVKNKQDCNQKRDGVKNSFLY